MGGEFLTVEIEESGDGAGGYAKEMSKEFIDAEMALFMQQAKEVDIVISTALIPNKPAPILWPATHVNAMKEGSIIVDLAAGGGGSKAGNCELTKPGVISTTPNGVTIIGYDDFPSRLPAQSSLMYGNNITKFLLSMGPTTGDKGHWNIDHADQCVRGMLVLEDGAMRWPPPPPDIPPAPPARATEEEVELTHDQKNQISYAQNM
jgi:NAD(P) transhydrogenase